MVYRSLLNSLIMVANFVEAHAYAQDLMHKQIGVGAGSGYEVCGGALGAFCVSSTSSTLL